MEKIIRLVKFIFSNFGPLIIFYTTNHFLGLKIALILSVIWSVSEILLHRVQKKPISVFFIFSAGITILFGLIDIYLQQSVLFKYEASVTNFLTGIFFAITIFNRKSLIQEFAENQGRINPNEMTPYRQRYFKLLTGIWVGYFWIKAIVYLWIASRYSLEEGLAFRMIIGNISFYSLLGISIFGGKYLRVLFSSLGLVKNGGA